jgi:hypothetical protein
MIEHARAEAPDVRLMEVDITEHPEVAVRYRVLTTPAIAINGKLEFLGVPREEALLARLRAAAEDAEQR